MRLQDRNCTIKLYGSEVRYCGRGKLIEQDFRRIDISGANLAGLDLGGVDFGYSHLARCDFRGSNLESVNFDEALLNGADLGGADMRGVSCVHTDFRHADLNSVVAWFADFRHADFRQAILDHVDFRLTDMGSSNMRGAFVLQSNFHQSIGLDLTGANDFSSDSDPLEPNDELEQDIRSLSSPLPRWHDRERQRSGDELCMNNLVLAQW